LLPSVSGIVWIPIVIMSPSSMLAFSSFGARCVVGLYPMRSKCPCSLRVYICSPPSGLCSIRVILMLDLRRLVGGAPHRGARGGVCRPVAGPAVWQAAMIARPSRLVVVLCTDLHEYYKSRMCARLISGHFLGRVYFIRANCVAKLREVRKSVPGGMAVMRVAFRRLVSPPARCLCDRLCVIVVCR
jgi:hypothetical protein